MNNHFTNACLALGLGFLFAWGVGSYIAWDVDPGHWSQNGRFLDALLLAVACVLLFLAIDAPRRRRQRIAPVEKAGD